MKSQWECVLQNLGQWQGSFTIFSSQGEQIEDIPSLISLKSTDRQAIALVLKRFYPVPGSSELSPREISLHFSTPNPGALFFETGAFSDGAMKIASGTTTIAEFCLVGIDRRLRMVVVFSPDGRFNRVTLIREQRQDTAAPERSHLTISDLLGTWQGTAITLATGERVAPTITSSQSTFCASATGYQWHEDTLYNLQFIDDRLLEFDRDELTYQLRLFPDASYCITPAQISPQQPCSIEIGWLHQIGVRQRLIRRYDRAGNWDNATFIVDRRLNA
jgi:hypothetical protein